MMKGKNLLLLMEKIILEICEEKEEILIENEINLYKIISTYNKYKLILKLVLPFL